MKDNFNREFSYLRLSITDICNFKCSYCLPDGCDKFKNNFLNLSEINILIKVFAQLGVRKVRITGGEPMVRSDFLDIIRIIKSYGEIEVVSMTTNGYKLERVVESLKNVGLTSINVSIDSLNEETFKKITGVNKLQQILKGIKKCQDFGIKVKINAVLLKDLNHHEFHNFLDFIKESDIAMRFIELMRTADNQDYFKNHYISSTYITDYLKQNGWQYLTRSPLDGPSLEFAHNNYKGSIGIIAPYAPTFCSSCNRLRVSANGNLYTCLFASNSTMTSLREYLKPGYENQLKEKILSLVSKKTQSKDFYIENNSFRSTFSELGG